MLSLTELLHEFLGSFKAFGWLECQPGSGEEDVTLMIFIFFRLYLYKRSKFKIEEKNKLHCPLNHYKESSGLSRSVSGAVVICKHISCPQELLSC